MPEAEKAVIEGPETPAEVEAARQNQQEKQERQARDEREAQERNALRAEVAALGAALTTERAARGAVESALGAQIETLSATVIRAPPGVSTARVGLGLTGFVQADLGFRQSAQDQLNPAGTPLNEDRFLIRRARLKATLERWWVAGALEFDGNTINGPTARLLDAEASLKWPPERGDPLPLLMGTIGVFKIPFGFEVGQSDRERLFMERSTASRALFPGEYDAGARLLGGWRFVRYMLAVQNGEPVGEKGGFPLRDPNRGKDVAGRIGIETPVTPSVRIAGGFSGLTGKGFHAGTPATKATLQWNDRNLDGQLTLNEIVVVPGSAASPSQNFSRFVYGGDLRIGVMIPRLGEAVLYGEVYWAKNLDRGILPADPVTFGRDYRELGYYGAITQELGQHAIAGLRYDFYNPDTDSLNQIMGAMIPTALSYQTLSMTAALRAPSGRLIAQVDINRNHNGRDLVGNPVNLQDNAFTIRGEVTF